MAWNIFRKNHIERARALLPIRDDVTFKEFSALYDVKANGDDPDWQNLLGLAYNEPAHSGHDPVKAHKHFMRAAELGWGGAAYNLARGWASGLFGVVDMERAAFWYEKGYEMGHGGAGHGLFEIMASDPHYVEEEFRQSARAVLWKSASDLQSPAALFRVASMLCDRSFNPDGFKDAKAFYEALAGDGSRQLMAPGAAQAALVLSLRYYLGFDIDRDLQKSAIYARQVRAANTSHSASGGATPRNHADRLQFLIDNDVQDLGAVAIVKSAYERPETLEKLAAQLIDGSLKSSPTLCNYLWAAVTLLDIEEHSQSSMRVLRSLAENQLLQVMPSDLIASTEEFGPLFNKRNQRGYLIPADRLDLSEITNGVGELVAIIATKGEVELRFRAPDPSIGALLSPEDIDVALCLAFSGQEPVWPAFTIDPVETMSPDRPRYDAQVKIWRPSWLENTLLGKTMYAADYWMGRLVSNSLAFDAPSTPSSTKALLRRIAMCGGKQDGLSGRIMLHPATFRRTWHKIQDGWHCDAHRLDMAVLGADMVLRPDGSEDWNANRNDTRFATGRAAAVATAEYDALCSVFPLFERARQLTALVYALNGLHEKGFVPSPSLKQRVKQNMETFVQRPTSPQQKRLILKLGA